MSRQSKLIILFIYLLLLAIFLSVYRSGRAKKVKALRAQLAQTQSEKEKIRRGEAELERLSKQFPPKANLPSVVESLYRFAKDSGIKVHEVSTEGGKRQAAARPGSAQKDNPATVTTSVIKVNLAGSFREIAEYIRQVQNMERFNRISEFKLTPDDERIKGSLSIEFFSLAVKP